MPTTLDVLAIGNAIVDVIAPADDALLEREELAKGSMRLIEARDATRLHAAMGAAREVSGGSAANTSAGVAALGARAGFIGRVADDALGETFARDLRAAGVAFDTPPGGAEPPTARCLVLVTPDGERTMSTYLGASQLLTEADIDMAAVASADVLYLEGYLWDPLRPRAAMRHAIGAARAAGRRVAFSLSDTFCVERHRDDFRALLSDGLVDILFGNEVELTALFQAADLDAALAMAEGAAPLIVATRGAAGAAVLAGPVRHDTPAAPVARVVDATGAGDLFAAGFLAGLTQGRPLPACAALGAACAAEVISHYGARPEADLRALAASL